MSVPESPHLPAERALPQLHTPAERTLWENYFRELDHGTGSKWLVFGPIVVGILLILSTDVVAILVGVVAIGAGIWVYAARRSGTIERISDQVLLQARDDVLEVVTDQALDTLKLDKDEDVLQEVRLVGGTWRPLIPGVRKTVTGVKPNPNKRWLPVKVVTGPQPDDVHTYCAAYWFYVLFALEDNIAYFKLHFDLIESDWPLAMRSWESNTIPYRFIENVQMTNHGLNIRTSSGAEHYFSIRPPDRSTADQAGQGATSAQMIGPGLVEPQVDERMRTEGEHFVNAVNRLRDEWERRQRSSS